MYGFSKDLAIETIVGRELNLLGLGRYDVQLNFDGSGLKICVQGPISLIENGKVVAKWNDKENWSSLVFQKLLNSIAESFSVRNKHLLEIKFSNGLVLQVHDDNPQYEVAQIYFEDKSKPTIIV